MVLTVGDTVVMPPLGFDEGQRVTLEGNKVTLELNSGILVLETDPEARVMVAFPVLDGGLWLELPVPMELEAVEFAGNGGPCVNVEELTEPDILDGCDDSVDEREGKVAKSELGVVTVVFAG